MARVGIAGDWHGNAFHATKSLGTFSRLGISKVYHLGDFGFGFGVNYEKSMDVELDRLVMTLDVVEGNHENYNYLNSFPVAENGQRNITPRIKALGRGQRWNIGDTSFVALGGAASVDREWRTPGRDWWPEEYITHNDVAYTAAGGYADVMLTHDLPSGVYIKLGPQSDWPEEDIIRSDENRAMLRLAVDAVKPRLLMHGHYHIHNDEIEINLGEHAQEEITRFVGFDREGKKHNLAILDTETLELEWIHYWSGTSTWEN